MLTRLRHLFPPSGPRYELFDTAVLLVWIELVAYVLFPVPMATRDAIGAPLQFVTERQVALSVAVIAGCAIALSYSPKLYHLGYVLGRFGALSMVVNFLGSVVLIALAHLGVVDPLPDPAGTARVALIYLMVYGYAARRLKRDNE